MNQGVEIDKNLCKQCLVCTEICPNYIFEEREGNISIHAGRVTLCIACGQCMAACKSKAIRVDGLNYESDFFELRDDKSRNESFNSLIESRRSIRSFRKKEVPKELLEQIVNAISLAPPSFPPIKTELTIVCKKETIETALPYMIALYDGLLKGLKNPVARLFIRRSTGKNTFRVMNNHIVPIFNEQMSNLKNGNIDSICRNAPSMILFHANKKSDNYSTDILLALSFGLLKAHALGLGATAIDLIPPVVERSRELRTLFKIPEENQVVAAMIVGYPNYRYQLGIKRKLAGVYWI